MTKKLFVAICCLFMSSAAFSQCYYYFNGTVSDSSGSALNAAIITISAVQSGTTNIVYLDSTSTTPNGAYNFCIPNSPGNGVYVWSITASACGQTQSLSITSTPNNTSGWQFPAQNFTFNCGSGVNCNDSSYLVLPNVFQNANSSQISFSAGFTPNPGAPTVTWSMGDGTTVSGLQGSHTYTQNGIYNICLYAQWPNGCTSYQCTTVTVGSQNTGGCSNSGYFSWVPNGNSYTFTAISTDSLLTVSSVNWNFFNGALGSGNPYTIQLATGTYNACAYITFSNGCVDTVCQSVVIDSCAGCVPVVSVFTSNPSTSVQYMIQGSCNNQAPSSYQLTVYDQMQNIVLTSTTAGGGYTFSAPGLYTFCATVSWPSGCVATQCTTVTVGTPPTNSGTVCGNVCLTNQQYNCAVVYLIQYNPANNTLNALDTVYTTPNGFCFSNVSPGAYLIKAALCDSSLYFADYLPTYYGNVEFWTTADQVIVQDSTVSIGCIDMIPGNNQGGPGFIGGAIFQGANKAEGDPMIHVQVNITGDNGVKLYTYTGQDGSYGFFGLPYGTYTVHPEVIGKITTPAVITLSTENPFDNDVNFGEFTATVLGINETQLTFTSDLYPNPASEMVSLGINSKAYSNASLSVFNTQGQELITKKIQLISGNQTINQDVQQLSNGFYILRISGDGIKKEFKLLVRH